MNSKKEQCQKCGTSFRNLKLHQQKRPNCEVPNKANDNQKIWNGVQYDKQHQKKAIEKFEKALICLENSGMKVQQVLECIRMSRLLKSQNPDLVLIVKDTQIL